jgi:hypothetical protein
MAQPSTTAPEQSLQDLLGKTTMDQIKADGIITIDEVEDALRAKGLDPEKYDHLYE